jgi:hypothetical protein
LSGNSASLKAVFIHNTVMMDEEGIVIMSRRLILLVMVLLVSVFAVVLPASAQNNTCGTAPQPRLSSCGQGRVTPGLPNILRTLPGKGWNSQIVGEIPANAVFTVLAGYAQQCANGMWWWLVSYGNMTGWTPEGDAWGTYWTEPYGAPPACAAPAPRLKLGAQGRVLPGLPNLLRSNPWKGTDSKTLGQIPAGGVFTVLDGPRCANNIQWWLVSYNGVNGWTGEGELSTYWLEPLTSPNGCPADLPTRLWAGGWGRVTPGLPNTLRGSASTYGTRLGQIPVGGTFTVISGPICADNIAWWQVTYNNVTGWTAEGRWGQYWLEPVR